jgi:hypothetical protein
MAVAVLIKLRFIETITAIAVQKIESAALYLNKLLLGRFLDFVKKVW